MLAGGSITHQFVCKQQIYVEQSKSVAHLLEAPLSLFLDDQIMSSSMFRKEKKNHQEILQIPSRERGHPPLFAGRRRGRENCDVTAEFNVSSRSAIDKQAVFNLVFHQPMVFRATRAVLTVPDRCFCFAICGRKQNAA